MPLISSLQNHLSKYSAQSPVQMAWAARNLLTGRECNYGSRRFIAASTIKLPILAVFASQRQMPLFQQPYLYDPSDWVEDSPFFEQLKATETVSWQTLAEWMMIRSDNAATNLLIRALGLDTIQDWIIEQGYRETFLQREMMDLDARALGRENWTSPQDMCCLMTDLVQARSVTLVERDWMLEILYRCEDPEKIPFLFRPPMCVANKPGELPGNRSDVGYVHDGDDQVVMAVFCDHLPQSPEHSPVDVAAAEEICDLWQAELAQLLWQELTCKIK